MGAHAEFIHVGLADDAGAMTTELLDDGRFVGGTVGGQDLGGALCGKVGSRYVVLDSEADRGAIGFGRGRRAGLA